MSKTLRLILGDQLNLNHSWFKTINVDVTYVLMEVRSETDYCKHHIQKVLGFFAAMRQFSQELIALGHHVKYLSIQDPENLQSIDANCEWILKLGGYDRFEYQLPDEWRLDQLLSKFGSSIHVSVVAVDTEHFYTTREELGIFFKGKKQFLMESFYRMMRKKHQVLMEGAEPMFGQWNFDHENRKKLPANHKANPPLTFNHNLSELLVEIGRAGVKTMGTVDAGHFIWPISRKESLQLLDFFIEHCLPLFGTYQDAMTPHEWSLYHSRLSFSMNVKMLSPSEVIDRAIAAFFQSDGRIAYHQLEGFVRQIIGWREYMRGMYWLRMPEFASENYFDHQRQLPFWFWNGKTKMSCLKHAINQSLELAYAHHIQRLMVTGNFALLAGVSPDEIDEWYLGVYIDALHWVELPNTRGMSQFADGGVIATKPYVSSASYIDKMSHYCGSCFYKKNEKTGDRACPFNSLYWHFFARHENLLKNNHRIGMMYHVWYKMNANARQAILDQAEIYLENIESL